MPDQPRFRVLIAGGGTGGHVFPALALAEALEADSGADLLFVGSAGGLEERLVPAAGHRLEVLEISKLRGVGLAAGLRALAGVPLAALKAIGLLISFKPHVVVGLGGYASAPVVIGAAALRLPVVLLEQNAVPGTVNRVLARLADTVVIAFRRAAGHLPGSPMLLGNPVRSELVSELEEPDPSPAPTLLVLGGSQGAHAVNQLVTAAAPRLAGRIAGLRIVHQTGVADVEQVAAAYKEASIDARVEPFIERMGPVYRQASLVVGRSGATTLAELCVAGRPALLIPYPYAADDHQAENALELVEDGAAVMRRQGDLEPGELSRLLHEILTDPGRLARMGQAMRRHGRPRAAATIATMLRDRFGP